MKRKEEIEGSSNKSFGIVFTIVFAIIGLYPIIKGNSVYIEALIISVIFLVISFTIPDILSPLNKIWLRFGLLLHKIVSPLLMGIIFFGMFVPVGLIMRLFGKNLLNLKYEPNATTYWIERTPPGPAPETMSNQF